MKKSSIIVATALASLPVYVVATAQHIPTLAFAAEAVLAACLAVAAAVAIVTAYSVFANLDALRSSDIDNYARAGYINYAIVGVAAMAFGYTPMAWWWIGVALIRAAIVFWAQDNRNAV